ncbi:putative Fe-S cluster assembly protein SufT [Candidatus Methylacidithermus pantelleriae]|uniref:Predicted metal-sulfur cluster biosynthetic enzyme n=1 Tax=Candidatus Methylacidithermus pantelleriae TaxID=2744239 RepID=A0A8J2BM98_9BACT|nr:putative Fe-S cluster assembly protein SufT [Candidatus Methylacidithermus pantelleriae]CAF0689417.1 Predicted metal-sulfur cluster biosynthetic enzyme [Candidatus Methylacidithermus pantelleriae]
MSEEQRVILRDVEAIAIPSGAPIVVKKGTPFQVIQAMGGNYTVLCQGSFLARIAQKDADALGETTAGEVPRTAGEGLPQGPVDENMVLERLREVFDPEIPVNIVDLGLVYDCVISPREDGRYDVRVKMTLTAPGCGMGPVLAQEAESKIAQIPGVATAQVELVWDPPWTPAMITEEGRMQLGLI